ncbi:hypothetical protein JB92DRAFT_3025200 [Gautieria morchelliformis]|nr:hypothetical protein JB92DRAFT_3025200 [Gautieria morchelliformis]
MFSSFDGGGSQPQEVRRGPMTTSDFEVSLEDMYMGAEIDVGYIHRLCVISPLTIMLSMLILILPSAFISISREPATRYPVHDQRKDPLRPLPWLRSCLQLAHPSHPTCSFPTCSTTRSTTPWALPRAASSCSRARATRAWTGRRATLLYAS